jgi:hypothetical protein
MFRARTFPCDSTRPVTFRNIRERSESRHRHGFWRSILKGVPRITPPSSFVTYHKFFLGDKMEALLYL